MKSLLLPLWLDLLRRLWLCPHIAAHARRTPWSSVPEDAVPVCYLKGADESKYRTPLLFRSYFYPALSS